MLDLLSKIKDGCHKNDVDLMHSGINGNAIKLSCQINGSRKTELNAYIIPDGDSFNFYTVDPNGNKSETVKLEEEKIIPTLVSALNPTKEIAEELEDEEAKVDPSSKDVITIEVEDGVYDERVVDHNSYKNSRYAYSMKYHKMGTITNIRLKK